MTLREWLRKGEQQLGTGPHADRARRDTETLLLHLVGKNRAWLIAHLDEDFAGCTAIRFASLLDRRHRGEPIQYIVGETEFFGLPFNVTPDVLIPRPETEHLVEAALEYARRNTAGTIVDVGTGSGAIAISLALELGRGLMASDVSVGALAVAQRNAKTHNALVDFFACDLLEAIRPGSIDLLVSNPPYVPGEDSANMQAEVRDWEPHVALFAGDTGFEIYRRLIAQACSAVKAGGRLYFELGYRSLDGVKEILATARWGDFEVISDLAGWPRVIGATHI